jgi:transcription elongation factor SPT6
MEIQEVFGNGDDYAWALEDDEEEDEAERPQPTLREVRCLLVISTYCFLIPLLAQIFEPSEISERMLTEADDAIRALDIPERMQLAYASFARRRHVKDETEEPLAPDAPFLFEDELHDATVWVAERISPKLTEEYLLKDDRGFYPVLHDQFLDSVRNILRVLCIDFLEVPFIWVHRRDLLVHFDPTAPEPQYRTRAFLSREDLWRIHALSLRFRALVDRKAALRKIVDRLELTQPDAYFEESFSAVQSVDEVADLLEWVNMKYSARLRELQAAARTLGGLDDDGLNGTRPKRPSRESRYERAKSSVVSKLAEVISFHWPGFL